MRLWFPCPKAGQRARETSPAMLEGSTAARTRPRRPAVPPSLVYVTETLDPRQARQHALIEEHAALQEMMQTEGWRVFTAYVDEFRREHEQVILAGGLTEPLDYRFATGRLSGINQVLSVPDLVERARDTALNPPEGYVDELEGLDDRRYAAVNPDEGDA